MTLPDQRNRALATMADAIKADPNDGDWVVWITPSDAAARALSGAEAAGFRLALDEEERR
jgi:glycine cleavage system H lipoate-binding protein